MTYRAEQEAAKLRSTRRPEPPDPKVMERFREILNKKSPWDN